MEKTGRIKQSSDQNSLASLNEIVEKETEIEDYCGDGDSNDDQDSGWDTDLGSDGLLSFFFIF